MRMNNFIEPPKRKFANQVLELLRELENCSRNDFQNYRLPKYRQCVLESFYDSCIEKGNEFDLDYILTEGISWGNVWYDDLEYDEIENESEDDYE